MLSCKQKHDLSGADRPSALYLHVPFCLAKCRYCDFYSLGAQAPAAVERYVRAAMAELELHANCLRLPLRSVFVGGGTPTAIGPSALGSLLRAIKPLIGPRTEFSVEANPGAFDEAVARVMIDAGVNRVNFGVQSFEDHELALLGRMHRADQAVEAVELARRAGLHRVGLDLIYGIPGQSIQTWRRSLDKALGLQIDHLSCYALSFEQGTPLWQDRADGKVQEMDDSLQRQCYDLAISRCVDAGLEHYEISNFARPDARCMHNLTYWCNLPYLGIGPAAASYVDGIRRTNAPDLTAYLQAIEAGKPAPATAETLGPRQRMAETLMLGLRLIEGTDVHAFKDRFGQDPMEAFPRSIGRHVQQGALVMADNHLRLARWALFTSDTVLADIISEASD